ncbi:class I glutamine amidotransferase-like protein [Bimuria novae-zelandiae CBS 107.79]|uniref:Class I glutamine amidotransferase-like protein n=1 Tax=Bimuria novae-zelandiae CBS 107.79 TaxID=1447943 RepID=A0A6A5UTZ2_9PLEO|nr:class I glutamine amidotransferase-like protein [Bimuria novae-zelandiae CBS 107.79]
MPIDLSNPGRTIHAGVILMGYMEILDVAPIDFLHGMGKKFSQLLPISDELKAKALDIEFHWVTEKGEPGNLTAGISMNATDSYDTCPTLDIVLIGAYFPDYTLTEADLAFIRKTYDESAAFMTICGGFLAARIAGVLEGHTCTAPRYMIDILRKEDPRTTWVEKRACRSGKVWTSGALLNGLDMMREFAKTYWPELTEVCVPLSGWPERSLEYEKEEIGVTKGVDMSGAVKA